MKQNDSHRRKEKVIPQEARFRGMSPPSQFINKLLWRPNNYRRQIVVRGSPDRIRDFLVSTPNLVFNFNSQNKQLYIRSGWRGYSNISFQLSKCHLVATWQQNIVKGRYKETFLTSVQGIEDKKKEITSMIDRALYNFVKEYGLEVKGAVPEWIRQEDWIKGEEYIDNLPRETIIYDSVFKKVYPTGVEFVSGKGTETTGNIKNYIKNRSLEDFSPLIASEINKLSLLMVGEQKDVISWLLENQNRADWFMSLSREKQDEVLGL